MNIIRFGTGIVRSAPHTVAIAKIYKNEKLFIYPFGYIQRPKLDYCMTQPLQIHSSNNCFSTDDSAKVYSIVKSKKQSSTSNEYSTETIKDNTAVQYLFINIKLAKWLILREV